jgi:hypothetical protein
MSRRGPFGFVYFRIAGVSRSKLGSMRLCAGVSPSNGSRAGWAVAVPAPVRRALALAPRQAHHGMILLSNLPAHPRTPTDPAIFVPPQTARKGVFAPAPLARTGCSDRNGRYLCKHG